MTNGVTATCDLLLLSYDPTETGGNDPTKEVVNDRSKSQEGVVSTIVEGTALILEALPSRASGSSAAASIEGNTSWVPVAANIPYPVTMDPGIANDSSSAVGAAAAEVSQAAAMWAEQASSWDQLTMRPYRGPLNALTRFNSRSPEVRRALRAARKQAKLLVQEAAVKYAPEVVAQSTIAAATSAIAVEAAAAGINLTVPTDGSEVLRAQAVSDISMRLVWDGLSNYGMSFAVGTQFSSDLAAECWNIFEEVMYSNLPWLKSQVWQRAG